LNTFVKMNTSANPTVCPDSPADPGGTLNTASTKLHKDSPGSGTKKKIWIDLDNSPHVPFFLPIIKELRNKGYEVVLTARNSYQVCELLEFHHISCKVVGRHWGKNRLLKTLGTFLRAAYLLPMMMKEKPDLAVSHGSRSQFLSGAFLGIPILMIYDYEFTAGFGVLRPDWLFSPHYISDSGRPQEKNTVMKYPGLKEDVYVPQFRPDPSVLRELGLNQSDLIVTVRPPATEAHYHNPEAEVLMEATLELLVHRPEARVILLPRNEKQAKVLRKAWAEWIEKRKIVIPKHVVDGLNLIWFSDLVISGGGTMNREAAALGIPVYSIFKGRIGAVDQYLAANGRLVLIEKIEDIKTKVRLVKRGNAQQNWSGDSPALHAIVGGIISIVEHKRLPVDS
jgi:predicted glycosyltransferase